MPPVFRVIYSHAVVAVLKELKETANTFGLGSAFVVALQVIHKQLENFPQTYGEELYSLPHVKGVVRHAFEPPLAVYWAVHEDEGVVFLQDYRLVTL